MGNKKSATEQGKLQSKLAHPFVFFVGHWPIALQLTLFLSYGEIGNHFCDLTHQLHYCHPPDWQKTLDFCIFYAIAIDSVEE